jgi:serine/threonine protein kinase
MNNIIHRDIKPHNILISKTASKVMFKISDFGFSCYDLSARDEYDASDVLCKKYFKLCGTPYYMAPELVMNMKKLENFTSYKRQKTNVSRNKDTFYSSKVDCWSFGLCIYELIMCALPFPNVCNIRELESFFRRSDAQIYINEKIAKMKVIDSMKKLVLCLLKIDPAERCSMEQFHALLIQYKPVMNEMSERLKSSTCEEAHPGLKEHVVGNPIRSSQLSSWVDVNGTASNSSVVMNVSVANGFMKWLMNNN